ncbi:MAG: class I SAM-dependent methyltransferase [Planctomycetes bacterium]|nr:class I SAM-dependent methyltransferase [Planctomycetota bacterium]MBI3835678.1 class I SAM-dependent methyltransferase [Planctomycetota bacterium]
MSRSKRSAVQRYHDRVAGRYDQSYEDEYWQWHDALTWEYLKPFLPREARATILDLGCGTGKWAAKLLKSGYRVVCVDISANMLDQTRLKVEEMGATERVAFVQADLCDLEALPKGEAAMAIALGDPIGCTTSPPKALKEIRHALRDDGVLVATFDNKLAALDFYLERGDIEAFEKFLRDGRTHWLTKDASEQFEITTFDPTELRTMIERAGFNVLDMVGKTVLPMRHHRNLLESPEDRRRWSRIERSLCRDPAAIGRASHIQVACRAH